MLDVGRILLDGGVFALIMSAFLLGVLKQLGSERIVYDVHDREIGVQ